MGRDAFGDDGWKPFIKVRDAVIEKTTGKRGGLLDHTNPAHWYEQIETLEKEVEGQGWDLQGPEICRLLWDVLPIHWRKVLKETKSYKSLLVEDFKDTGPQVVTSRYTGLVTALYENFGHRGVHELGTALTTEYQQGELETTFAYAERIRSNFAKDLGASWHEWPGQQRTNYARRFVLGLTEEDYKSKLVITAEHVIAALSWVDFTTMLLKADEEIGPRADRIRRVPQALRQTSEAPAARPTQFPAVAGYPSNQAYAPAPGFLPAQPHQASANSSPATVHMQSVAPAGAPTPLVTQQWPNYQGTPMSCSQVQDPPVQDESVARIKDRRCMTCLDSVPEGAVSYTHLRAHET